MILWGRTFPYFCLASGVISEEFNSDGLDSWVSLDHNKIVPTTETVTDSDGNTYERDVDYEMDYTKGKIKCLSTGNMNSNTDYYISYKYTVYEKQLGGNDGLSIKFHWEREGEVLKMQSGKKKELKDGYRFYFSFSVYEDDSTNLTDFFRILYSWNWKDKRVIYLFPHPSYMGGFRVIPMNKFEPIFIGDKWFLVKIQLELESVNIFDNLPSHNLKDNCDIQEDIPWI